MQQAVLDFTNAFVNLLTKITQQPAAIPATPAPAPAPAPLTEMPKNFSDWLQKFDIMNIPGKGLLLTVLKSVSCVKWTPTQVDFVLLVAVDGAEAALPLIKNLMANSFGFSGNVALKQAKVTKPATPSLPKITVDDCQKAAVALCTKLKDKSRVYAIIKQFGADKIENIATEKLGDLKAAFEAAMETSPQMAESADESF